MRVILSYLSERYSAIPLNPILNTQPIFISDGYNHNSFNNSRDKCNSGKDPDLEWSITASVAREYIKLLWMISLRLCNLIKSLMGRWTRFFFPGDEQSLLEIARDYDKISILCFWQYFISLWCTTPPPSLLRTIL